MLAKIKTHLPFIILFLILTVYLSLKTLPENGWSEWLGGEGDAQTLLSTKHWVRDGFFYSKFLFTPIGYSKIVQYLDNPEMRHHAKGIATGELIGKRLRYTHYPAGYLIPHALLMKFGVVQRHWFRLLALVFSFTALILLYWFFNLILALRGPAKRDEGDSIPLIAFFAILYYAISTMFLDYADSLANQPIDDLLRAAILALSVLVVTKCHSSVASFPRNDKIKETTEVPLPYLRKWNFRSFNLLIWFLYFLLSISSYDSTFFVFIWLVGLDIVVFLSRQVNSTVIARSETTKQSHGLLRSLRSLAMTNMKKWLFYASASVLGFALQMLQNWWYLGSWKEVWLDMMGAAVAKAYTSNIISHFATIFYPFSLMAGFKTFWAVILVFALFIILWRLKYLNNITPILIVFFLAGAVYPFIFISAGRFSYQGRQMMLLIALLVGLATIFVVRIFRGKEKIDILLFSILMTAVIFLWGGQIYRTIQYVYDWPNNQASDYVIQLSKSLRSIVSSDSAIFYIGNKLSINTIAEYYFDVPIFSFKKEQDLVKDFLWFRKKSQYPFEAIIMTDQKGTNDNLRRLLLEQKIGKVEESKFIQGEYIFKILP